MTDLATRLAAAARDAGESEDAAIAAGRKLAAALHASLLRLQDPLLIAGHWEVADGQLWLLPDRPNDEPTSPECNDQAAYYLALTAVEVVRELADRLAGHASLCARCAQAVEAAAQALEDGAPNSDL